MEIKRPFDRGWGKPHPKCPKEIDEYEEFTDKQGIKDIRKKGTINFYDEIQARGECVEIKDVIKRYKLNVSDMPLVEIEETINSIHNMPTDWTEVQNVIARTKQTFEILPKEERAKFNNSAEAFVKSLVEKDDKFKAFQERYKIEKEEMKTKTPDVNETMNKQKEGEV